jgi:hypothetical protein
MTKLKLIGAAMLLAPVAFCVAEPLMLGPTTAPLSADSKACIVAVAEKLNLGARGATVIASRARPNINPAMGATPEIRASHGWADGVDVVITIELAGQRVDLGGSCSLHGDGGISSVSVGGHLYQ